MDDASIGVIKAWADLLDAQDIDAGRLEITDRRLLVHVIRDHVNVINTFVKAPDLMKSRKYKPEAVWAAAALADHYGMRNAEPFVRVALRYCGLSGLGEGVELYLDRHAERDRFR